MTDPANSLYRKGFLLALVVLITAAFIGVIADFLIALLLAAIFSGLLTPLYRRILNAYGGREVLASLTVLALTVVVIVIPLFFILGLVASEALSVSKQVVPWVQEQIKNPIDLSTRLPDWLPMADQIEPYKSRILSKLSEFAGTAGTFLVNSISKATQGTIGFVLNLFILLYAMFFFLIEGPALLRAAVSYLPLAEIDRECILDKGLSVTRATLKSILIIGVLQGALIAFAFLVVGIEGAFFWGAIVMVLSTVPGLGAPLVWVPAALYLLLTSKTVAGIGLIIWGGAIVGSIDNVLRPRLVGGETKMPDILILVSTLGGITAFGAIGIIIGPIVAALFLTVLDIYRVAFRDVLPGDPEPKPEPDAET